MDKKISDENKENVKQRKLKKEELSKKARENARKNLSGAQKEELRKAAKKEKRTQEARKELIQETKKENTRKKKKKIRKKEFKKNVTKKEELKTTARKEAKKEITKNIKKKNELDFILDIPLQLSVELGKTKMLVNDLLQLGQGSIIELNKMSGEPLEVYINGKLIAKGEVVVVNEKFGIRLTDIITPMDRVKSLST